MQREMGIGIIDGKKERPVGILFEELGCGVRVVADVPATEIRPRDLAEIEWECARRIYMQLPDHPGPIAMLLKDLRQSLRPFKHRKLVSRQSDLPVLMRIKPGQKTCS